MKCSKCGEELIVDDSVVLTSYPSKYKAWCENCGDGYVYCKDYETSKLVDAVLENIKEFNKVGESHE